MAGSRRTLSMLELFLWRHAKAVPAGGKIEDFERPLAARGHRDAALIAKWLAPRAATALVLCSPARRTRETLDALVEQLPQGCELRFMRALYLASPEQIADALRALPDSARRVVVIGHNPGIHQLALALVDSTALERERALGAGFPTAALAQFQLRSEHWVDFDQKPRTLLDLVLPRRLASASD